MQLNVVHTHFHSHVQGSHSSLVSKVDVHIAVSEKRKQKVEPQFVFPLLHDDVNQGISRYIIEYVDVNLCLKKPEEVLQVRHRNRHKLPER